MYIVEGVHNIKASFGRRFLAFMIDHFVIVLLVFLVGFSSYNYNVNDLYSKIMKIMVLAFILYLFKDCFKGFSLGKFLMGLQVKNVENLQTPSVIKLVIRNLFTFIWPIEVICIIIGRSRRKLGDLLANTDVYYSRKKLNKRIIIIAIVVGILLFITSSIMFSLRMIKNDASYIKAINYIEKSQEIFQMVGDIQGFGSIPSGGMSVTNGEGNAHYLIKVIGDNDTITVNVELIKDRDADWEVIEIGY
ncbi:RDD family protein [Vallitalea guaymasensis]|uniref:RDD family protein n=1 Tax=Vallitalea guaymasensis TaxID=1185412 RepID=UPI0023576230|nr:RDD family protein [Vallitalea guaymasensis]